MSVKGETTAPSIGSVDLSFDGKGNRVRQILRTNVDSISGLIPHLQQADLFASQCQATRKLLRAFTNNTIVAELSQARPRGYTIEASIPLSNSPYSIVYFGQNHPERRSSLQVLEGEMEILEEVHGKAKKHPSFYIARAGEEYRLERLNGELSDKDWERMIEMYQASFRTYPFSVEDAILDMVEDPNTQVYAARSLKDQKLYAVCTTEQVTVNLNGRNYTLREMGDSAKMPEAKGLNAPLKLMLLKEAANDGADVVFCETRAALRAVNDINHSIGMEYCGTLPKHTVISGPEDVNETFLDGENGIYGNMNVWALNREGIQRVADLV